MWHGRQFVDEKIEIDYNLFKKVLFLSANTGSETKCVEYMLERGSDTELEHV